MTRETKRSTLWFACFAVLSLLMCGPQLVHLARYSSEHESCSHILLIPLVSGFLVYMERKRIFSNVQPSIGLGTVLLFVGIAAYYAASRHRIALDENDYLSGTTFSIVTVGIAGFILCYGTRAFRAAAFPLLFLLLMIPIPSLLLERSIYLLQKGSTAAAHGLFTILNVPVYRDGFMLSLPGISIEVAQQCSGIRSSLALFITSLLAGHLFLKSTWGKCLLCLTAFPLAIFKNGARIVTLSMLGVYLDRSFLSGDLHRKGGFVFFGLALGIMFPVLRLLQRFENKQGKGAARSP